MTVKARRTALLGIESLAPMPKPFLVCGKAGTPEAKEPSLGHLGGVGVDAATAAAWAEKGYVIGWYPARCGLVVLDDDTKDDLMQGFAFSRETNAMIALGSMSGKGLHLVFQADGKAEYALPRNWITKDGERGGQAVGRVAPDGTPKKEYVCFAEPQGYKDPAVELHNVMKAYGTNSPIRKVPLHMIEKAPAVGREGASLDAAYDLAKSGEYREALDLAVECLSTAPEGGRNDLLFRVSAFAGRLDDHLEGGVDEEAIVEACETNGIVEDYGLDEVLRQRDRGLEAGRERPWEGRTQRTVSDAFLDPNMRIVVEAQNVVISTKNEDKLTQMEPKPAQPKVKKAPNIIYIPDGNGIGDGTWYVFRPRKGWMEDREALSIRRHARANDVELDSRREIEDYLATVSEEYAVEGAVPWNRVPTHVGLPDGKALSLKTGKVVSQRAAFYIRRSVSVEPDFDGRPDVWMDFLRRVLPNPEMRNLLRNALAYSLSGLTEAQMSFWCFGPEASGKSTVADTIRAIFGTYAYVFPDNTMVTRYRQTPAEKEWRSDLGSGVRFAVVDEVESRDRLNERDFKVLVAGSSVTERRLYKSYSTFTPTSKIWFFGNTIPRMDVHGSLTRRIVAIPFNVRIPEAERDEDVKLRLMTDKAEHARILGWIVRRAMKLFEAKAKAEAEGTPFRWFPVAAERPRESQAFVSRMMVTNDAVKYFVTHMLATGSDEDSVLVEDIRDKMLAWAREHEHPQPTKYSEQGLNTRIGAEAANMGGTPFRPRVEGVRKRGYKGLRWR